MSGTARTTSTRTSGVYVICRRISQRIRQRDTLYLFFQKLLYTMPVARIFRRDQGDGLAAVLCARRTTDAVDIVLGVMRHVVVDDQRHIRHVDTARDDIRSNQHGYLPVAEIEHHLVAFVLLEVAVHRARVYL